MSETDVLKRKNDLIRGLRRMGIFFTSDGRRIEEVSLYTLEWTNITARCELANESC